MRLLLISMAVLLVLTLGGTVLACDCVVRSPAENFQYAEVVFEGTVVRSDPSSSGTTYKFRVEKLLKGSPAAELTLVEGLSNCDAEFEPNTVYRVYARSFNGNLSSSICAGNETLGVIRVTRDSKQVYQSQVLKLLPLATIALVATIIWLVIRRRS